MVDTGDRVMVESEKVGEPPRTGVVTGREGSLIKVDWDGGGETLIRPSAGALIVVDEKGRPTGR